MHRIARIVFTLGSVLALWFAAFLPVSAETGAKEQMQRARVQKIHQAQSELREARQKYALTHPRLIQLQRELDQYTITPRDRRMLKQIEKSELRAERTRLKAKIADDQHKYTDTHPTLQNERRELEQVNQRLAVLRR